MPNRSFGGIVRRLGLRYVDNGAGHGADKDNASASLTRHQVLCSLYGEQVGAIDVDSPQLLHTIKGVRNGIEVLGEAGRCHEVVDLAVLLHNVRKRFRDGFWVRDIGVMGCDLGQSDNVSGCFVTKGGVKRTLSLPGSRS